LDRTICISSVLLFEIFGFHILLSTIETLLHHDHEGNGVHLASRRAVTDEEEENPGVFLKAECSSQLVVGLALAVLPQNEKKVWVWSDAGDYRCARIRNSGSRHQE
jgi:hypothetical protein